MDQQNKSNKPVIEPGGTKKGVSNLAITGLAAGLASAFIVYDRLLVIELLGQIDELIIGLLANLGPVAAVVLSLLALYQKKQSDLSKKVAVVGLVVGVATLLMSVLFFIAITSDASVLEDNPFDIESIFNF